MTLVATPPGQANNMRFQWLLGALYEARSTQLARAVLSAAVGGGAVLDSTARRLLGRLQVEPLKVLRLLERGGGEDAEALTGQHLLMEGYTCLADFYALLEIALQLNLSPWPLRQKLKNEAVLFMAQERFGYFYQERYPMPLVVALRNRLNTNTHPSRDEATHHEVSAFHTLLSARCHYASNPDLKLFLCSLLPPAHERSHELTRTREERALGHRNGFNFETTRRGFWQFMAAAREIAEVKASAPNTRIPLLVDSFFKPWIDAVNKNHEQFLTDACLDVDKEFHGNALGPDDRAELYLAVRKDIRGILAGWLAPPETKAAAK